MGCLAGRRSACRASRSSRYALLATRHALLTMAKGRMSVATHTMASEMVSATLGNRMDSSLQKKPWRRGDANVRSTITASPTATGQQRRVNTRHQTPVPDTS